MLLLYSPSLWAFESLVNRCLKYYPQVIREARYQLGLEAPSYYFMGQIEQESRCNAGITAFDGGMGLGQFMPGTAEWIQHKEASLKDISMQPNPYDPRWSIRALVLYDNWLYKQAACPGWYYAFRSYNGGVGLLNREIKKAGSCSEPAVEKCCSRKVLHLKTRDLDMCKDVNIPYPYLIFNKAKKYELRLRIDNLSNPA